MGFILVTAATILVVEEMKYESKKVNVLKKHQQIIGDNNITTTLYFQRFLDSTINIESHMIAFIVHSLFYTSILSQYLIPAADFRK